MSLESRLFNKNFYYAPERVERFIDIIQSTDKIRRKKAYKDLVFKMMKDIVMKNVGNYINLMNNSGLEVPDRGEIIADCYFIFDKCLEKYKTNQGFNFYFYFNKSLTRNFYTIYKTLQTKSNSKTTYVEDVSIYSSRITTEGVDNSTELLIETLGLTEFEKKICRSKILGISSADFLKENDNTTKAEYQRALRRIKEVLLRLKNKGEL